MRYTIYGRSKHLSDIDKESIKKSLDRLDRILKPETVANVTVSDQPHNKIGLEVTIPLGNIVLRAESSNETSLKSAIQHVVNRLRRQLSSNKTKIKKYYRDTLPVYYDEIPDEDEEFSEVLKEKKISIKPLDVEEAKLQMDLVDHDFFIFINNDTGMLNILYRRKDNNYGLIEPYF